MAVEGVDPQTGYCARTRTYHSKMAVGEVPSQGTDLVSYLFERRRGDGAVVALVDGRGGRELTYSKLEATVRVVAAGLVERLGVTKGDVLGILSPNSVEFEVLFLAAASLGVVTSAQNPLNTAADVKKLFRNAGRRNLPTLFLQIHIHDELAHRY
jgi:acyl-coenzyme A synthetase/AMP-(fatty) acid ligase